MKIKNFFFKRNFLYRLLKLKSFLVKKNKRYKNFSKLNCQIIFKIFKKKTNLKFYFLNKFSKSVLAKHLRTDNYFYGKEANEYIDQYGFFREKLPY
jgi:hypothetical protein